MPQIQEDLKAAESKRDERTLIGAVVGFFIGIVLGWDGLFGIVGAVILGYVVYSAYDTEVQSIKKIGEIKK